MALKFIIDLSSDILEERDEKRQEKILGELDVASSEYLKRHGKPAYEELKNDILSFQDMNLNEETVNRIVNHIANGHLSSIRELLWADLVYQGAERDKAYRIAAGTFAGLLVKFFFIQAAGPEAEIGQYGEVPQAIITWITKVVAVEQKQRLICPNCYRVIRQQTAKTGGFQDMGPSQIKCKECSQVVPTNLIPWSKKSILYKVFTFGLPLLFIIGSVWGIIWSPDNVCITIGGILILCCLILVFNIWRESKASITIPIW